MSHQKTINKMKENILSGASNFVGTKSTYCNVQKKCEQLKEALTQYNLVLKQNQSLQREVLWQREQMEKGTQYLIKLEESNMLLEQDVEILKKQVGLLKNYKQIIKTIQN